MSVHILKLAIPPSHCQSGPRPDAIKLIISTGEGRFKMKPVTKETIQMFLIFVLKKGEPIWVAQTGN
jgi:hypothetical protein